MKTNAELINLGIRNKVLNIDRNVFKKTEEEKNKLLLLKKEKVDNTGAFEELMNCDMPKWGGLKINSYRL